MIRAVIFDIDDTLYPEDDYVKSGFRAVAQKIQEVTGIDGRAVESELWEVRKRFPTRVFDAILQRYPNTGLTVGDLVQTYRSHEPDIRLDPTVCDVLRALRSKYRLGIISDGILSVQQRKVEALGLAAFVDVICLTDTWGRPYWKPHERAFLHVLNTLGIAASEGCYVGDNLTKDFIAPNRLGMHSVHLARSGGVYAGASAPRDGMPSTTIKTISELPLVLDNWARKSKVGRCRS